ncbi:hypothetical protein OH492_06840 [Vibrio chagasii]|nr:hypothetical protein [Vibrio chagasii]
MAFELPASSYAKDALEPHISAETPDFHHGKHHNTYVVKLNGLILQVLSLKAKTLEEIVKTSTGGVFNNAAQIWNHTFYWHRLLLQSRRRTNWRCCRSYQRCIRFFRRIQSKIH